jgi:4-amino-4-deoxy-L-arabinose transferase-like glycosyltransferase
MAVKFLQGLLDALVALMIYHLLSEFPERTRLLGSALWAFFPPSFLYTNFLLSESVFTFLLTASVLLLQRSSLTRTVAPLALGALFGLLVLMKPSFLLFLVLLPVVFVKLRVSLRPLGTIAVGTLLVIAPWLARNYLTLGSVSLSTNGGINLLIGNNPNTTGAYAISWAPEVLQPARSEIEANKLAFDYAARYIVSNPGTFFVNGVKKIAHLFESEGGLLVWSFHNNPEDAGTRYAAKYASLPVMLIVLVNVPYFGFMVAGILGFLAFPREKLWWIFAALLTSWLITHFVFFGGGRFHFPLMPFLAIFSARFLSDYGESLRQLSQTRKIIAAVAIVALLGVWIAEGIIVLNV